MASTENPAPEPTKVALETEVAVPASPINLFKADLALRLLLFATSLMALVVMVTSKQTKKIYFPLSPFPLVLDAKFNYSPALIYFVVATSSACLYSIVTAVLSSLAISKSSPTTKLLLHFALFDVLFVGVMASATGAAASIAYIGLKGNSHVGWIKVCNIYGKFCQHAGSSIIISLVASIILVLLVVISTYSLYRRSH